MAQGNVEFTKKVNYQIGKTDYSDVVLDEYEKIEVAQHILNAQINGPDTIEDTEMPPLMLGADLDWGEGVVNDLLVGIAGNSRLSIVQDLDDENILVIDYQDRFSFHPERFEGEGGPSVYDITIPTKEGYIANFIIKWWDGQTTDITSWDDPGLTRSFNKDTSSGVGIIEIKGVFEYLNFEGNTGGIIRELSRCTNIKEFGFAYFAVYDLTETFQGGYEDAPNLTDVQTLRSLKKWSATAEIFNDLFKDVVFENFSNIPSDLFDGCSSVTSISYGFSGSYGVEGSTKNLDGFLDGLTSVVDVSYLFLELGGTNFDFTNTPADLFKNNTLIENFSNTFKNSELSSIPIDFFKYNTAATDFSGIFYNCGMTSIPEGIFDYNPAVNNFSEAFYNCSLLTELPVKDDEVSLNGESLYGTELFMSSENNDIPSKVNIFDYNTLVTNFSNCFYNCSSLTSIPSGIFDHNTAVNSFMATFENCSAITSIPSGIFDHNTAVNSFMATFEGCSLITEIPSGIFDNNPVVLSFSRTFEDCSLITSIPVDLFRYNTLVTLFVRTFQSAGITALPVDLFRYNIEAIYFTQIFTYCSSLTTISASLFEYNTEVLHFTSAFHTTGITSIPIDLFRYNIKAYAFGGIFGSCDITSIPVDLFRYNILATRFDTSFYGCDLLNSIPVDLFRYNTVVTNFFRTFGWCTNLYDVPDNLFEYNTIVDNFSRTFENNNSLSGTVTGTGELYDWMQSHNPSTTDNCFTDCDGIQDWDLIPSAWGGGGLAALTNNMNFTIHGQDPTTWDFTLQINNSTNTGMDIEVDWGDGTAVTTITDYTSSDATHTYTNGEVDNTLNIKGKLTRLLFTSEVSLTSVGTLSRDLGLKYLNFQYCTNLTDISNGGIEECRSLITAQNLLNGSGVSTIPTGLFDKCYYITDFSYSFYNLSSLTTIPTDLFKYNTLATVFYGTFFGTGITTIPADLFKYNTEITRFDDVFRSCSSLTAIPVDLFRYNTKVTRIYASFHSCSSLAAIPADIFRYNVLAEYFDYVFRSCGTLSAIPADLFLYNTAVLSVRFSFQLSSNITTAVTGAGNLIAQVETNNGSVNKSGCFDSCTSITDYASIPIGAADWRTV